MSHSLPPPPALAAALVRRGANELAVEVLHLAVGRGDRDAQACRAMLESLRAGASWIEPAEATLDVALAVALVERGRLYEARAVCVVGGLVVDPIGARLLTLLERALAPLPPEADPSFAALLQLIRIGQASSAARALDEVLRAGEPPAWLVERHRSLRALVAGTYREVSGITHVTRDLVLARLRGRDLAGALEAARMTGATDLANVLARLVAATDGVLADGRPDEDDPETMPIEGHRLCEFQLRIGALEIAEQGYRAILRSRPGDEKARSRLADLIEVRRALGDEPEPMPPRPPGSVDALRKNAKRAAGAWGKGGAHPRFGDTDNDTTGNLEASQEAELLLKLGKAEAALDVYRILAIRHPKQQIYRRRIAEIEALIAQRLVSSGIEEITVRKDLSALSEKAIPTLPHVKLDELVTFQQDEDDEVTQVDAIPPHRRRE